MAKTRRDFIRISSLSAVGLVAGGKYLQSAIPSYSGNDLGTFGPLDLQRTPTYCEVCFWKCAGWVYKTDEGKIKKIIGNDDDPNCNGRLCPRGTGGVGMYYDEDRLKTPLIRETGEDGNQTFREASWEEALDLIAKKLKEVEQKYGGESLALFSHGSGGSFLKPLLKAMGSGNYPAPSYAQCKGPREVAFNHTFGEALHSPEPTDIRDTRCLVLIGSHIGENMHNGQVQEMSDAIDKGATIITVDPRFSTAASKSKYWMPTKPGTDIALLLAWIREIIYNDWYDKDYIEKYAYGFEQLKSYVQPFTPEWAYGITTLKPEQIRETAREMANASPAVIIHPGRHTTWYGDDTQRLRAVAILNALLGSWGRRGGFYIPDFISIPSYPMPEFPTPKWNWRDSVENDYPLAGEDLSNGVIEASLSTTPEDKRVRAWIVNGTNLPMTMPDQATTIKAMQELEFMVVIDTMPMEVTGFADVVLPECTYLERYDAIRALPGRFPTIALRMPAVEPRFNTKPDWWIAKELSKKLGLEEYFAWNDVEEMLDWQLKQIGSSLEEMKRIGVKQLPREYGEPYFTEDVEPEFYTNTGKIELYSTAFAEMGYDPLPVYKPNMEPPAGYYHLNYGRAPMHTFSRTSNNPNLVDLMEENSVWVNPKIAKQWYLENGQEIYLENQDGVVTDFPVKVRVTERIRFDSVYIVHGFGHANKKLSRAFGKGASDSKLITRVLIDSVMGGTGMRGNFVTFRFEKESEVQS